MKFSDDQEEFEIIAAHYITPIHKELLRLKERGELAALSFSDFECSLRAVTGISYVQAYLVRQELQDLLAEGKERIDYSDELAGFVLNNKVTP